MIPHLLSYRPTTLQKQSTRMAKVAFTKVSLHLRSILLCFHLARKSFRSSPLHSLDLHLKSMRAKSRASSTLTKDLRSTWNMMVHCIIRVPRTCLSHTRPLRKAKRSTFSSSSKRPPVSKTWLSTFPTWSQGRSFLRISFTFQTLRRLNESLSGSRVLVGLSASSSTSHSSALATSWTMLIIIPTSLSLASPILLHRYSLSVKPGLMLWW